MARPVTKRTQAEEVMHLAVVACGNRLDETLTMVKSALLFSLKRIKFHIFAEDPLAPQFAERVRNLEWADASTCTVQSSLKRHHIRSGNRENLGQMQGLYSVYTSLEDPQPSDLMQRMLTIPPLCNR